MRVETSAVKLYQHIIYITQTKTDICILFHEIDVIEDITSPIMKVVSQTE